MVNEDSPVRDFYPMDFETDLNGVGGSRTHPLH